MEIIKNIFLLFYNIVLDLEEEEEKDSDDEEEEEVVEEAPKPVKVKHFTASLGAI